MSPMSGRRRLSGVSALVLGAAAALSAAAAEPGPDPTLDQVIDRHVEALGGRAALDAIEAVVLRGTYTSFSEETPFTLYRRRPASYRFETTMLGDDIVEATDGETAWSVFPPGGIEWALTMTPPEVTAIAGEAELFGPLVGWRDKGHRVELAGRDDLDGVPVWRLEVERADGARETWLLDAETYLPAGRIAPTVDFGRGVEGTTWYSDFRPVGGVMFPHRVESEFFIRHRVTEVASIEVDPELDPALFTMPLEPEMARLAPLAGEWRVKVESRPSPRAPWTEAEGEATFTPLLGGRLLEERLVYPVLDRPITAVRLHSWDRFRGRYRLAHADDLATHLNLFEGGFDDGGRLALDNLATGTSWEGFEETLHHRWTLFDLGAEGMTAELEESTDAGESWELRARLTYRRPGAPEETADAAGN